MRLLLSKLSKLSAVPGHSPACYNFLAATTTTYIITVTIGKGGVPGAAAAADGPTTRVSDPEPNTSMCSFPHTAKYASHTSMPLTATSVKAVNASRGGAEDEADAKAVANDACGRNTLTRRGLLGWRNKGTWRPSEGTSREPA